MLYRFFQGLAAAQRAFRFGWRTGFAPCVILQRHAWENGINYDIPAFLRRKAGTGLRGLRA